MLILEDAVEEVHVLLAAVGQRVDLLQTVQHLGNCPCARRQHTRSYITLSTHSVAHTHTHTDRHRAVPASVQHDTEMQNTDGKMCDHVTQERKVDEPTGKNNNRSTRRQATKVTARTRFFTHTRTHARAQTLRTIEPQVPAASPNTCSKTRETAVHGINVTSSAESHFTKSECES